ncbi:hypothetical protein HD554DRAFT_2325514 [Boletus coccyginus]|nr:hypothetical protein HD554DRAFT_2325514 [Boletus coccyginus]
MYTSFQLVRYLVPVLARENDDVNPYRLDQHRLRAASTDLSTPRCREPYGGAAPHRDSKCKASGTTGAGLSVYDDANVDDGAAAAAAALHSSLTGLDSEAFSGFPPQKLGSIAFSRPNRSTQARDWFWSLKAQRSVVEAKKKNSTPSPEINLAATNGTPRIARSFRHLRVHSTESCVVHDTECRYTGTWSWAVCIGGRGAAVAFFFWHETHHRRARDPYDSNRGLVRNLGDHEKSLSWRVTLRLKCKLARADDMDDATRCDDPRVKLGYFFLYSNGRRPYIRPVRCLGMCDSGCAAQLNRQASDLNGPGPLARPSTRSVPPPPSTGTHANLKWRTCGHRQAITKRNEEPDRCMPFQPARQFKSSDHLTRTVNVTFLLPRGNTEF